VPGALKGIVRVQPHARRGLLQELADDGALDTFEAALPPLSVFDGVPKVRAWRAALAVRPSVRDAVSADYPERLALFLRARGSHLSRLMA
jgi:hypothetical protein